MMLAYSDLQKGTLFILDGDPYEVLESQFLRMQQRKPVVQAKIKNLISGKITSRSFHQNEIFKEANIERRPMRFIFAHRGQFTFSSPDKPGQRISLNENVVGPAAKFLKTNMDAEFLVFGEKTIGLVLPIKADYIVKSAPPSERGNTAQGGTKEIILENGLTAQVPFFINEGDTVRINTQSGEYVERVKKA
jgi:elongation factor P